MSLKNARPKSGIFKKSIDLKVTRVSLRCAISEASQNAINGTLIIMKLFVGKNSRLHALFRNMALGTLWSLLLSSICQAQILYVVRDSANTLGSYDAATGQAINASLITGLTSPYSVAYSAGFLYIGSIGAASPRIGKYNLNGTAVNESFISGIKSIGIAVSGTNLYATKYSEGKVGLYSSATGTAINASLITGLGSEAPRGITLDSAGNMYIANTGIGTVSKYAADGTLLNAELIKGLSTSSPFGIAVDDAGNVFVANFGGTTVGKYDSSNGTYGYFIGGLVTPTAIAYFDGKLYVGQYTPGIIGTYDAATGASINVSNWITGVQGVTGIAIPEASTVVLLALGGVGFLFFFRKRRSVVTL